MDVGLYGPENPCRTSINKLLKLILKTGNSICTCFASLGKFNENISVGNYISNWI
jgi:hypothetical protein